MNRFIHWIVSTALTLAFSFTNVLAVDTIHYIHADALGSPVAATDESGDVVWREQYRPYGERILDEAGDKKLWFTGKLEESATGLMYYGARWYNPVLGRFTGVDPIPFQEGNIHSFNRYAYANNNPYKFVDPDGREAMDAGEWGGMNSIEGAMQNPVAVAQAEAVLGVGLSIITGGGVIGAAADMLGLPGSPKKLLKSLFKKRGYRAVSDAELKDIKKHGFRQKPDGRSMEDKWFSETRKGAEKFRKLHPEEKNIIKAKVPRSVYDRSYKHPNIDDTGPGFAVPRSDLPKIKPKL